MCVPWKGISHSHFMPLMTVCGLSISLYVIYSWQSNAAQSYNLSSAFSTFKPPNYFKVSMESSTLADQKIALKDKKCRIPMNGKFSDTGNAYLVVKYPHITLQNIKINKVSL